MAKTKKRKSKGPAVAVKPSATATDDRGHKSDRPVKNNKVRARDGKARDDSDDSSSSSSDDDSLVLEGVLIRNPDASESDSSDDGEISSEEEDEDEDEDEDEAPMKKSARKPDRKITPSSKARKDDTGGDSIPGKAKSQQQKKQQKRKKSNEPEMIHVEFLFCDVHVRFFHGMKTLLHRQSFHAPHSSQLADLIIENEMIGTVLSTDLDSSDDTTGSKKAKSASNKTTQVDEANVFGFASIINLTTNQSSSCIQALKCLCLDRCPSEHKTEMETVLSGRTKRPAGFFFHERMVNVPLEITFVLHQQLVLDMDHAVDTANGEDERKILDYGAFVRLAPCLKGDERASGGASGVVYKYFDDEIFATNAEFVYNFKAPKSHDHEDGDGEELWCSVIVLTKTGHRGAMKELKKMIHGC